MKNNIYRQGDVLIERIAKIPTTAKNRASAWQLPGNKAAGI
jgi:hypothetical protein